MIVIHTIFQAYLFKETASQNVAGKKVIIVTDLKNLNLGHRINGVQIIYVKNSTKCKYQRSWQPIKEVVKKLDGLLLDFKFNLYYSQISYPLSNYLVYNYRKRAILYNYPEGICNFVPPTASLTDFIWRIFKWALGPIYGARYWPYIGGMDGIRYAQNVLHLCGLPLPRIHKSKKVSYVRFPNNRYTPNKKIILFIGIPLDDGISTEEYFIGLNYAFDECEKDGWLYYKPHPRESGESPKLVSDSRLVTIDGNESVEELVANLKPAMVFGFASSALVNVRLIYGPDIVLKSVIPTQFMKVDPARMDQLILLFKHLDIGVQYA